MSREPLKAPKVPCGSCPYRKDVPPGIWEPTEYVKLLAYDGPTWAQDTKLFFCHQNDGCLCGGWLACHGPTELLAMRAAQVLHGRIDPAVWTYDPGVEVFASGQEAAEHGMSKVEEPPPEAHRMIAGLIKKRARKAKEPCK